MQLRSNELHARLRAPLKLHKQLIIIIIRTFNAPRGENTKLRRPSESDLE